MARQAQRSTLENSWEGSHHEVLEGIYLVGEEAPSFREDPLLQAAMGEEMRRMQAKAKSGAKLARRYVGTWRKIVE